MEEMEGASLRRKDPILSQEVTDYTKTVGEINLWLLAKRVTKDGMNLENDPELKPIMTRDGAKAYISWLESITAKPITLSKQKHNTVARRLILNCLTMREMLMSNSDDWNFDFDKYSNQLVEIQDTLGTSSASGSIDGFTLSKLTENLNINENRDKGERGGILSGIGSNFKRGGGGDE